MRLGIASLPAILLLAIAMGSALAAAAETSPASCNPFFPLATGTRWTYRESMPGAAPSMERTLTVKSAQVTANGVTAEMVQEVRLPGKNVGAAGQAMNTALCENGQVTLIVKGTAEGGKGGTAARGSVSARLPGLPPANLLVPGYQWRSQSEIDSSEGPSRAVTRGVRENKVEPAETVVVPAGTFRDAIKVLAIETLTTEIGGNTHTARQELVEWYARGVGLLKRETRIRRGQDIAISTEILERFSPPAR